MTTIGSPGGTVLYDPNSTDPLLNNPNYLMAELPDNSQHKITAQDVRNLAASFIWHANQGVVNGLPKNPHNTTAVQVGAIATIQGVSGNSSGNVTITGSGGTTITTNGNNINIDSAGASTNTTYNMTFCVARGKDAFVGNNLTNALVALYPGTIITVTAYAKTAPQGVDSALVFDILKNGTSIWNIHTTNRISIKAGSNSSLTNTFDITTFNAGDVFTFNVVQIGSTTPGRDITVQLGSIIAV